MKKPALIRRLLLPLAALALSSCFEQEKLAGTESGTGIKGMLTLEGNAPAGGADVYAFARTAGSFTSEDSALFLRALDNPDTLKDTSLFRRAVTDAEGAYTLSELAPGSYSILGFHIDDAQQRKWVGLQTRIAVEDGRYTQAGALQLLRLGGISALVTHAGKPVEGVECHVPGLSFGAKTDEAGRCVLMFVPQGVYRLRFDHKDYLSVQLENVAVEAGEVTAVPPVDLKRSTAGPPPPPGNLRAVVDTARRLVTLRWDPVQVEDVVGYALYRKPLDSMYRAEDPVLLSTLVLGETYTDTLYKAVSDTAGVTYYYRIKAGDGNSLGEPAAFPAVTLPPAKSPILVELSGADYSISEGGGSAEIRVRRRGPSDRPLTVRWSLSDSSALRDADYQGSGGTLAFAPGDTVLAFTIPVIDNLDVEPTEHLLVRLSPPSNGALLGSVASARVTLRDDDSASVLQCVETKVQAGEKDTAATLSLRRAGEVRRKATLQWATREGSAKAGSDYLADSGLVTFDSGAVLKTIRVRLANDTLQEKSESFFVDLGRPSRDAVLQGGCEAVEVAVADDDTNFVPVKLDISRSEATHVAVRGVEHEGTTTLWDGSTAFEALEEHVMTAPGLAPKVTAHWDFKDCGKPMISDLSGNLRTGKVYGALQCAVDAAAGAYATFTGEDSIRIEGDSAGAVAADSILDVHNFPFTLIARVRVPDFLNKRRLMHKLNAYSLEAEGGQIAFTVFFPPDSGHKPWIPFTVKQAAAAGAWMDIAAVYDGANARLLVNGVEASVPAAGAWSGNRNYTFIGRGGPGFLGDFDIQQVRLYKRALTGGQAGEIFDPSPVAPRPMTLTLKLDTARQAMAAQIWLSSGLGSTRYKYSLEAASTASDLEGATGSYKLLAKDAVNAADAWSRIPFPAAVYGVFRFTVAATEGTGHVRINEVEIFGAKKVEVP